MPPLDPNLEAWLQLLSWFGVLFGGGFAIYKWFHEVRENRELRAQELLWKQKEALIERITAFGDTPGAYNAILMLSSPDREIPLWDKQKPEDRYVRVTWDEVAEAMVPEDMILPPKLSAIRDSFGDFLSRLTHIELYRISDLLNDKDVKHVVSTWATKLAVNQPHARNIRLYIRSQGLQSVEILLRDAGGLDIAKTWDDDNREYQLRKGAPAKVALPSSA